MNIIRTKTDSHWYDREGNPRHTYLAKDGTEKHTTLREARKFAYLPGTTNFLSVFAEPGLVAWQRGQDILSALTMPALPNETLEERANRVQEDSERYMREKAAWGSKVHSVVEQVCKDKVYQNLFGEPELNRVGAAFQDWFNANVLLVLGSEERLVNLEFGYAGTADFIYQHKDGRVIFADFKTPALKGKDKVTAHDKWGYQLAAYHMADAWMSGDRDVDEYQTIVLPSDDYDNVVVHEWSKDKRWETLRPMAKLGIQAWRLKNNFPWTP